MTHLLIDEPFISHSKLILPFKIDADALTDFDLATVAHVISDRLLFNAVHFIPRGGFRLARALLPYITPGADRALIVDDVMTTGASMDELRGVLINSGSMSVIVGIVLFARGPCPAWVTPFFTLHEAWR